MVDSIFQALKPLYLSLYEPDLAQSRIVSKRCTITQKAIEEILLERDPSMLHRGEYVHAKKGPSTILVKKQLDDPSVIAHTLEHEMFHIQRRDWLRKNKKIYNKLPIEAMKTSYFKKAILLYLNETKKGIMKPNLDFYYGEITRSNI
ncbi:hypothetical protein KA013_05155 [Patescibacteria group bacterium]|nr:hypothetical protein [Patescibacteria group bacterium]